jgi:hypothetical protein
MYIGSRDFFQYIGSRDFFQYIGSRDLFQYIGSRDFFKVGMRVQVVCESAATILAQGPRR